MYNLEEFNLLPDDLKKPQLCANCGHSFRECGNIGQLACLIHPGVQLRDNRTGRVAYSCCGYDVDSPIYRDQKFGCLRCDHMSFSLPICSQDARLRELGKFQARVIPQLLMQFITAPLQESIIFCLSHDYRLQTLRKNNDVSDSFFIYESRRLNGYYATYEKKRITSTLYVSYRCEKERDAMAGEIVYPAIRPINGDADMDEEDPTETQGGKVGSYNLRFDLEALLRGLYQQSRVSPLFTRVTNTSDSQHMAMLEQCNKNWKNKIVKKRSKTLTHGANMADDVDDEEEDATALVDLDKQEQIVPFSIVSRLEL